MEGVIIGIDPGIRQTGYAVLRVQSRRCYLEDKGVFKIPAGRSLPWRLNFLYESACQLFSEYRPAVVVFESIYSHTKHPYTSVIMGHARGVLLLSAQRSGARVSALSPARIKRAITGRGNASKEQVRGVIAQIYSLGEEIKDYPLDVSDAIAIATGYVFMRARHGLLKR